MSLARKIASSTISQIIAKFLIAGLSVVSVKLITTYLGTEGYGEYTVVYEMMAFALIMADFGFFHIALREMGKDRKKMSKILANIMSLRFIISLVAILITLSIVFLGTDYNLVTVKYGLMIASANVVFGLMGTTITAILQVHLKMTYAAMIQVIGKIVMVSYIAYAVWQDLGFLHTLWAGLIGSMVILLLTYFYTLRYEKIYFGFDLDLWKGLFKETLPMGIALICYNIYLRSPILILDRMTLNSHLTGVYGVAQRIVEILMFIPIAFMNSTLPTLSDLFHNPLNTDVKKKINNVIQISFDFLNAISFPVIVGTLLTASKIINIISGEDFYESARILQILMTMIIFYFISTLFTYVLIAQNQQRNVTIANAYAALSSVLVSVVFIPIVGVYGALGGHIIPEFIAMVLTYYFARKHFPFELKFMPTLRIFFASLFMGGVILLLPDFNLALTIVIACVFYLIGLFVFQALPFSEMYSALFKKIEIKRDKGMKLIAIDYRSIYGNKTGKEWYTFSLLQELSKIDPTNHYVLYSKYDFDDALLSKNCTKRVLNTPISFWHFHVLVDMYINKIDVLLATSSYIIASLSYFIKRFKVILVVHDLVAFLFPPSKHWIKAVIIERLTGRLAFSRADHIIVPSKNTANDLSREFPKTKGKTSIIAEAARSSFRPIENQDEIDAVLQKYKLPQNFMIFIGTLEPRKNLVRMIIAYANIDQAIRDTYSLVIVGKKGWYYNEIFKTIKNEGVEKNIIFTGYVPDEDLPYMLNRAKLCLYPSKYEGFGLPLLEAMMCKTPIVSSNTPALLEVAMGVCEIADRKSVSSIRDAIIRVVVSDERRAELIEKGYEKSSQYSWNKTAQQVLKLL